LPAAFAEMTGKMAGGLDNQLGICCHPAAFISEAGQEKDGFLQEQPVNRMLITNLPLGGLLHFLSVVRELPAGSSFSGTMAKA
jgi:hypothetical protein